MRRDRHKFYLEAFSLMAPIAWQGSTPASNSGPELLLPADAGGEGPFRHHRCPAAGILPQEGEGFACASKGAAMPGVKPCAFPFPGMPGSPPSSQLSSPSPGHLQAGRAPGCRHSAAHPSEHGLAGGDATELGSPVRTGHGPRASLEQGRAGGSRAPPPP